MAVPSSDDGRAAVLAVLLLAMPAGLLAGPAWSFRVPARPHAAAQRAASQAAPPPQAPGGRSEAEALRKRAVDRMHVLQREADELASRERTLLGELRRLEVERDLRTEEARRAEAESSLAQRAVDSATGEVNDLAARLQAAQPMLAARLVAIYRRGRPGYARLLLSVDDPREIGRALRMAAGLAAIDRARIQDYESGLTRLSAARAELAAKAARATTVRQERLRARDAAERAVTERAELVRSVDGQRDLAARLVAELEQAEDRLRRALAALTLDPAAGASAVDATILPVRPFKGDLPWPADGEVVVGFGTHRNPRFGTTTIQTGIEIKVADEAPVRAIHGGRVAFADVYAGFGQLVIVDHGGQAFSLYGFLASIGAAAGARVRAGDVIGTAGRGPSGASALYFELRIDARPVDPVQWLRTR